MKKPELITWLKERQETSYYTEKVSSDRSLIPLLLEIIETDKTAVKFQAEKIIRKISEDKPIIIYPYFERLAKLLDCRNNFIKWGVILMIPNLLKVDNGHLWYIVRERYLKSFQATQIAEFGNAIKGLGKILTAYPEEEKNILPLLLAIDNHTFLYKGEYSKECQNVAKGQIIDVFDELYPESSYKKEMILFTENNLDNERKSVKAKAKKFLNKII